MIDQRRLTTEEKALKINLTQGIYGSFSEIGAGQEVAANFFKAGGSSGTIAFSHSAYDMKVSDSIYGKARRYVCEERLLQMLDREFETLTSNLDYRKKETRFFSFSNTVESLNYHKTNQGQGWVGVKFQIRPDSRPNSIVLHVNMHDHSNKAQQEALGILGVNLLYAAYYKLNGDLDEFVSSIVQRLPRERIEIDMLRIDGPDFEHIDNRILALKLVKQGLTEATMFDQTGMVLQPATALYKKNILLIRGRFRPVTKVHINMITASRKQFLEEEGVDKNNVAEVFELTLKDLTADGKISDKDFIDRAELLGALGHTVMISNYLKYYKMVDYLSEFTRGNKMGVILGIYNLHVVFDPRYYENLNGGLLEAFGRGFGRNVKMYVYPARDVETGELYMLEDFRVRSELKGLLQYMIDNNKIEAIKEFDESLLHILSDDVLAKINAKVSSWENDVPEHVVKAIKFMELFGFERKDLKDFSEKGAEV